MEKKNNILKALFILFCIFLVIPSLVYIFQNRTVMNFEIYYNFFLDSNADKIVAGITFLVLFAILFLIYLIILKKKEIFKNIKQLLIFVGICGFIFLFMLPWTSSDIFYYMGVGELDGVYGENPYYTTVKDYYEENKINIDDEILEKGAENGWSDTTVVYGPVAQLIFKVCTLLSFKSVDIAIVIFKLLNLIIHLINTYLVYKISGKKLFAKIYGLNPFIFLEFIGNVHNDIIVVFFMLLAFYFLLKRKKIVPAVIFLGIATGLKYFTILLLPIFILFHYRKEEKIGKRFVRCIQYGVLFMIVIGIAYLIYFKDFSILSAMLVQTEKYSKSIYSSMHEILPNSLYYIKILTYTVFFMYYAKLCIDTLTTKEIKWKKVIIKYNTALILFSLVLGTFQQWYIIWIFASIMWQKNNMIKNIIGITLIAEVANSVYMFKTESYIYDIYFVEIIILLLLIWQIGTNKVKKKKIFKLKES